MAEHILQRSFAAGEIAPSLYARADTSRYQSGLRECFNFVVKKHGGVENRAGTMEWGATKNTGGQSWLIPWVNTVADDSVLLEFGGADSDGGYIRFWDNEGERLEVLISGVTAWSGVTAYTVGDLVSLAGTVYYCILAHTNHTPPNTTYWYALETNGLNAIYELPGPWTSGNWDTLQWSQSGDVMTLTDLQFAPRELYRISATEWQLLTLSTAPTILPPATPLGTEGSAGTRTMKYVVTAAREEDYEESEASAVITLTTCGTPTIEAPHVLTWTAVADAAEYYIYCDPYENGQFGYIGTALAQTTFNDSGFAPDYTVTPPVARLLFASSDNYPRVNGIYQQRRWFGYTGTTPEHVYGSRVGFASNFGISSPLQEDDAVTFRLFGRHAQVPRHIIDLEKMVLLTEAGEWVLNGDEAGAITPRALFPRQHGYVGSSIVKPAVIGKNLIHVQARGNIVRDLQFEGQQESLLGGKDLTIYSGHLFEGQEITRIVYQANPNSIVWALRADGVLLSMTYVPEQEVAGWAQHPLTEDDIVEDICVMPIGEEDALFLVTNRTDGRHIERMMPRQFGDEAWYMDAAVRFTSPGTSVSSGIDHLDGRVVAVYADGAVLYNGDPDGADAALWTVTSGSLELGISPADVLIGLYVPYRIQTLSLDVNGTDLRTRRKNVKGLKAIIERSSQSFYAGSGDSDMVQMRQELWETPVVEDTKTVELAITSDYNDEGRVIIEQRDPLPLTVLAIAPMVEAGG